MVSASAHAIAGVVDGQFTVSVVTAVVCHLLVYIGVLDSCGDANVVFASQSVASLYTSRSQSDLTCRSP